MNLYLRYFDREALAYNADEAIDAMKSVGDALPCALKETAGGGMAATPSAIEWAKKYFARK